MDDEVLPDEQVDAEEHASNVDTLLTSLLGHLTQAMTVYQQIGALEPNMIVGMGSFPNVLESCGAEFAARWRYHQETGSW